MTTVTSKWTAVASATATVMRAVSGYRNPTTESDDIPVFLGPDYGVREMSAPSWLTIAWCGDPDSPEPPGRIEQLPAAQAASVRPRDETGTIRCRACAQTGDRDFISAMTDAQAIVAAVETAVRSDPYIGLTASSNLRIVQVLNGQPDWFAADGAVATWTFELVYTARL